MDDFTFPATAASAEPADTLCLHHHHHRRLPFPHFASPPLWFPLDDGVAATTPALAVPSRRPVDDMDEQEPTSSDAGRRSDAAESGAGGEDEDDEGVNVLRGTGAGEEKMDMLWENFNEELEALRRAGSCSKAAAAAWGLQELSDTESERGGRGCAPMLRASSRAGGTGRYYHRSGGSWVLLMRIFKRLFVVEKTVSASSRHRQAKAEQ